MQSKKDLYFGYKGMENIDIGRMLENHAASNVNDPQLTKLWEKEYKDAQLAHLFSEYPCGLSIVKSYLDKNQILTRLTTADVPAGTRERWCKNMALIGKGKETGHHGYILEKLKFTNLYKKREMGETLLETDFLNDFIIAWDLERGIVLSEGIGKAKYFLAFMSNTKARKYQICVKIENFYNVQAELLVQCRMNWQNHPVRPSCVDRIYDTFIVKRSGPIHNQEVTTLYTIMEAPMWSLSKAMSIFSDFNYLWGYYAQILLSIVQMDEPYKMDLENLFVKPFYGDPNFVGHQQFFSRTSRFQYTRFEFLNLPYQVVIPSAGSCSHIIQKEQPSMVLSNLDQLSSHHTSLFDLPTYGKDVLSITHQFYTFLKKKNLHPAFQDYLGRVLDLYMNELKSFQDKEGLKKWVHKILTKEFIGSDLWNQISWIQTIVNDD